MSMSLRDQLIQAGLGTKKQAKEVTQPKKAAAKARRAEVKQLIEQHRLPPVVSEEYYNFADGNRLSRLAVTPALREQLIKGTIVIVRYEGHYAVVPESAVARIRERDEHAIVTHETSATAAPAATASADSEDPYKD